MFLVLHHGLRMILTLQSPRFAGTLICLPEVNFLVYLYDWRQKGVDRNTILLFVFCVKLGDSYIINQNLAILLTKLPQFSPKGEHRRFDP